MALTIDTGTEFGERAIRRLDQELVAWLVTVNVRGTPQPVPVWFLWDADRILLYSRPDAPKLRNIEANPHVALHLDGDGEGGDIVVVTGTAQRSDDPPADRVEAYARKYAAKIAAYGWTPASFAADYSVPVRVTLTRLRGH
jgi:PPOX class probable F420-dependent enzyme